MAAARPPVRIGPPTAEDEDAFLEAVAHSRGAHHPWVSPPATAEAFRAYIARRDDRNRSYLIRADEPDGELVGVVNANEIVRGAFLSCYLGYYGFAPAAGRGLMTIGLRLVLDDLFGPVGLHRVEANIQPANARSIALVRRLGFRKEGFSPDYLRIAGAWRDHERWALLSHEHGRALPPPA
ncbi:GNAT family N-acetyltransferase [Euzebya sp.]|uniref:GNAT family N-acetyltransferase n=1 Tax=Euzebya sp. TaxID=1971409 RepID=UPI003518A114